MGESTSDYSVHAINPVLAVILGFCGFAVALSLQFWVCRYIAWTYWLAVVGVGVFGTMAADVVLFVSWQQTEKTLSFHTIDTPRREAFYWAAVVATFAMGTALGDLTSITAGLGYFSSGLLFVAVIAVPAVGYWRFGWNAVFSFWLAYVATRPVGASFADWLGKPTTAGGLGFGAGRVALSLTIVIFCLVAYLGITQRDVQSTSPGPEAVPRGP
jgi:uncharacterized membrane-anchored protein